ncbi:hypothetical protein [Curtobacterium sp. MCLR17_054]|uniref:hypothetical protein n=1 Tax=Curtobacterium sp. MCLR17_054 TaxID=2175632 RepID=UPI0011B45DD6|nr:hypothetical protein [Curtobacterium sp. MCLR17_054]WIE69211.1 hypothetical protein DEJ08_004335 [Curtobacterium sp. MCLR17_054]
MKKRREDPVDVGALTIIGMAALRGAWDASPPLLRDLHQCSGFCRSNPSRFHCPETCDYIFGVDHQQSVDAATDFVRTNQGHRFPGTLQATQVSPILIPSSATAELALSLLTDPIELHGTSIFNNGRHRATALFDVGVTGMVPVKYV